MMESANRIIVWVFYAAFGLLGFVLVAEGRFFALAACYGVAGVGFVAVTLLRKAIAAPRPYQNGGLPSRIAREGQDDSFPSRHCFSAFLIASLWGVAGYPVVYLLLMALAVALGVLRVRGGVHYLKDITGAFGMAILFALVAFALVQKCG